MTQIPQSQNKNPDAGQDTKTHQILCQENSELEQLAQNEFTNLVTPDLNTTALNGPKFSEHLLKLWDRRIQWQIPYIYRVTFNFERYNKSMLRCIFSS